MRTPIKNKEAKTENQNGFFPKLLRFFNRSKKNPILKTTPTKAENYDFLKNYGFNPEIDKPSYFTHLSDIYKDTVSALKNYKKMPVDLKKPKILLPKEQSIYF